MSFIHSNNKSLEALVTPRNNKCIMTSQKLSKLNVDFQYTPPLHSLYLSEFNVKSDTMKVFMSVFISSCSLAKFNALILLQ